MLGRRGKKKEKKRKAEHQRIFRWGKVFIRCDNVITSFPCIVVFNVRGTFVFAKKIYCGHLLWKIVKSNNETIKSTRYDVR